MRLGNYTWKVKSSGSFFRSSSAKGDDDDAGNLYSAMQLPYMIIKGGVGGKQARIQGLEGVIPPTNLSQGDG